MRERLRNRLCVIVAEDGSNPSVSCLIYYTKYFLREYKKVTSCCCRRHFFVDYLKIVGNVSRIEIIHNHAKVHKQK